LVGVWLISILKALRSLRAYTEEIKTSEDALNVPGIGKFIATKLGDVLKEQQQQSAAVSAVTSPPPVPYTNLVGHAAALSAHMMADPALQHRLFRSAAEEELLLSDDSSAEGST
jgi:hypothetical protein